jgi:hypothetical protein
MAERRGGATWPRCKANAFCEFPAAAAACVEETAKTSPSKRPSCDAGADPATHESTRRNVHPRLHSWAETVAHSSEALQRAPTTGTAPRLSSLSRDSSGEAIRFRTPPPAPPMHPASPRQPQQYLGVLRQDENKAATASEFAFEEGAERASNSEILKYDPICIGFFAKKPPSPLRPVANPAFPKCLSPVLSRPPMPFATGRRKSVQEEYAELTALLQDAESQGTIVLTKSMAL